MYYCLILQNIISPIIRNSIRLKIREEDWPLVEPCIQRLLRNGLNPNLHLVVIRMEDEKGNGEPPSERPEGQ
jgi:hypothetical protein